MRCRAYQQSEEYAELLMRCTNPALRGDRWCRYHRNAANELIAGALAEDPIDATDALRELLAEARRVTSGFRLCWPQAPST